jgi:D-sedoheptulose 7-phosphate isomerase
MHPLIDTMLAESQRVRQEAITRQHETLLAVADLLVTTIASGHKVLIFGNGGAAAQAQLLAADFVQRLPLDRQSLPAIALTTDGAIITGIGDTEGFEHIFARQVEALGRPGDLVWAIAPGGQAANIRAALASARKGGLHRLIMAGPEGRWSDQTDLQLTVPSKNTACIRETHVMIGQILCQLVAHKLFPHKFPAAGGP